MHLDGCSGEVKRVRDLLVAEAQCHEREHSVGQTTVAAWNLAVWHAAVLQCQAARPRALPLALPLASSNAIVGWTHRRMLDALIRANAVDKAWAEALLRSRCRSGGPSGENDLPGGVAGGG